MGDAHYEQFIKEMGEEKIQFILILRGIYGILSLFEEWLEANERLA